MKLSLKTALKKELTTSFRGWYGPLAIALYLLTYSIGIVIVNINGMDIRMTRMFEIVMPAFVLLIPVITTFAYGMDLKNGVMLYIDRSRNSKKNLVLAKFLCQELFFTIGMLMPLVVCFVLQAFGSESLLAELLGIGTFWLLGSCMISIGLLVSSYSDGLIVGAGVSFCVFAIDFMIPTIAPSLVQGLFKVQQVSMFSLFYQYRNVAIGYPDLRPVLVYLIVGVTAYVLTLRHVEVKEVK